MHSIRKPSWALPERLTTPEDLVLGRRQALGLGAGFLGGLVLPRRAEASSDLLAELYLVPRNERYVLDRPLTSERLATSYNNYYEFGSHKQIAQAAQALVIQPWEVVIDGLVEQEQRLDAVDLIRRFPLEERVYRLRCVEAWSMAVPWSGFALAELVAFARPLGDARYLRMETFHDAAMAPGQRQFWYPWPYVEGLTLAEATNELAFVATGLYGKPLPKQNGAPLRLVTPWKYGFKSAKSIRRFTFTAERPVSFWEELLPAEYGFWANVNPQVPHPRWSQAEERVLGTDERVPTLLFNGYGEFVASLYDGLAGESLFM